MAKYKVYTRGYALVEASSEDEASGLYWADAAYYEEQEVDYVVCIEEDDDE